MEPRGSPGDREFYSAKVALQSQPLPFKGVSPLLVEWPPMFGAHKPLKTWLKTPPPSNSSERDAGIYSPSIGHCSNYLLEKWRLGASLEASTEISGQHIIFGIFFYYMLSIIFIPI
ncbi:hypothetical protein AMTRI_Chr13g122450 [Amborella trichopoda]